MSNHRSTFILTGGGLLTLAIVGFTARQFQLGPYANELASWSPMVAYGTFAGAAIVGVLLLLFAPSSRRVERRVQLDRPDAANPVMARPGGGHGAPKTAGMRTQQAAPRHNDSVHNSKETAAGDASVAQRSPPRPAAAAAKTAPAPWAHPNDAAADEAGPEPDGGNASAAPPGASPRRAAGKSAASSAPSPAHAPPAPSPAPAPAAPPASAGLPADRATLRARLEDLDRQANHAKVRYGLGQLSANGYRQVLAKLDEARAQIEETLLKDLEV